MAIKVLIQRKIQAGKESELGQAIREVRSKAVHAPGFISGETLRSLSDPSVHLVISTWKTVEDWINWADTPERQEFQKRIDRVLTEPATIGLYQYE